MTEEELFKWRWTRAQRAADALLDGPPLPEDETERMAILQQRANACRAILEEERFKKVKPESFLVTWLKKVFKQK